MSSGQIIREDVVRRMTRALRSLPSLDRLTCATARAACYVQADVEPTDIAAHDAAAMRVERLRRETFAAAVPAMAEAV